MPVPRIESSLISFLSRLTWPGNVRQLENTLKRMLVLNHKTLSLANLPEDIKQNSNSLIHNALVHQHTLEEISKNYVKLVLDHFKGNKKEACSFLNINYRTLQRKLENI